MPVMINLLCSKSEKVNCSSGVKGHAVQIRNVPAHWSVARTTAETTTKNRSHLPTAVSQVPH